MPDASSPGSQQVIVPPGTQEAHGALVALILGSESMNPEERQYWINILPVMTPDQRKNLEDILMNEKRQLAAIDAKYAAAGEKKDPSVLGTEIKKKKQAREQAETADAEREATDEEAILSKIESL